MSLSPRDTEETVPGDSDTGGSDDEVPRICVGVLPNGKKFAIPTTMSVMAALMTPASWMCPATMVWIFFGLLTTSTLFLYSNGTVGYTFMIAQFVVWRMAYNIGLGVILRKQSNELGVTRLYNWMMTQYPTAMRYFVEMVGKHATNQTTYDVNAHPVEFNAWLTFRFLVNIILANDLIGYFALVLVSWDHIVPRSGMDVLCYIVAVPLHVFALWSKTDAHRVIGDYAWYWGDFFFKMDRELVFDGVFTMVPHPMYTVGYSFMYGCAIMTQSYEVFFASIFGHVLQLLFLAVVENPHIEKTYRALSTPTDDERRREALLYDEEEGYFEKKELVVVKNLTLRSSDIIHVVLMGYVIALGYFLGPSPWLHLAHSLGWRIFHTVALGWILREQSERQRWTKLFRTPREAFDHWKRLYNTSVTIVNLTFVLCAIRHFEWHTAVTPTTPHRWVMTTMGMVLVGINVGVSMEVYETLGDFGFFYGDFFIDGVPRVLNYSGIYRYLNNPDTSVGFCGYYGAALISGSPAVAALAALSQISSKAFEIAVERPHMQRRYGTRNVRPHGGLAHGLRAQRDDIRRALREKREEYDVALGQWRAAMERSREFNLREEAARRFRKLRKVKE